MPGKPLFREDQMDEIRRLVVDLEIPGNQFVVRDAHAGMMIEGNPGMIIVGNHIDWTSTSSWTTLPEPPEEDIWL
jgi:hypothetical protein